MVLEGVSENVLQHIGKTPMIRLNRIPRQENIECTVLAKCEFFNAGGSAKDRIAKLMVEEAEREGILNSNSTLIEPTSGNTGIGLALVSAVKGYRTIITLPEKMSAEKVFVMKALGAEIVRTPTEAPFDSAESHIGVANRLRDEIPGSVILDQYRNANNPNAHELYTALEILEQTGGKIDMLVAGVGTGGTITGIARALKKHNKDIKIVGVDPVGSILALPESLNTGVGIYHVEGIGYDFVPDVLDRSLVDVWVKTSDKESFLMARRLIAEEGLLCGGSSGSAVVAAMKVAKELEKGKICVVILPDSIRNYITKFLDDNWMLEHSFIDNPRKLLSLDVATIRSMDLKEIVLIEPSMSCSFVLKTMKNNSFDLLPVVNPISKGLIGIVSSGRIFSFIVQRLVTFSDPIITVIQNLEQYLQSSVNISEWLSEQSDSASYHYDDRFVIITLDTPIVLLLKFFDYKAFAIIVDISSDIGIIKPTHVAWHVPSDLERVDYLFFLKVYRGRYLGRGNAFIWPLHACFVLYLVAFDCPYFCVATGARFRQRKISIKAPLQIYRAADIPDLDEEISLQRSVPLVETGVDKDEEDEHHLRTAIASQMSLSSKQVYIPTPDASKIVDDYEKLYKKTFIEPSTFIRFSTTVEDCEGCSYSMNEEDSDWLLKFNANKRSKDNYCSEDVFELIMNQFELFANEKQTCFYSDVLQIADFSQFESIFTNSHLASYKHFAKQIFPYWKHRRIFNNGKQLMPSLRFEENEKDDNDPYVCFRRREIRQTRKTRRSDAQSSEKLRKLRSEMEQAYNLIELVVRREQLKKESLLLEQRIFNQRCHVKEIKRKLGIKDEDDDLVSHKRKKVHDSSSSTVHISVSQTVSSNEGDALFLLEDYQSEKTAASRAVVEEALRQKQLSNVGWKDITDNPYCPYPKLYPLTFFRTITASYCLNAKKTSLDLPAKDEYPSLTYDSFPVLSQSTKFSTGRLSYRQRIGRGGRIMIDRKNIVRYMHDSLLDPLVVDRHKYDNDDFDSEIEIDDMNDLSLKYRIGLLSEEYNLFDHSSIYNNETKSTNIS
ncbi:hypothetical protein PMAC_001544 [Pneumocystis sp. 'macacae']|nr:hypothetical protein PMAC_001544 [Pneumocystis sp. 'macacae']